jgi:integrase
VNLDEGHGRRGRARAGLHRRAGADEVAERLGHGSIAITEKVHAHLLDDAKREAAAMRADMLHTTLPLPDSAPAWGGG